MGFRERRAHLTSEGVHMNGAPDRKDAIEALLVSKREDLLHEIRA